MRWAVLVALLLCPRVLATDSPIARVEHHHQTAVKWNYGVITTYSPCFDGRKTASGRIFRHRGHLVASRSGSFGQRVELRYGRNGRSIVMIADRGRLPLHSSKHWQFDVSQRVAKELGLYRLTKGQTDRRVRWRFVR